MTLPASGTISLTDVMDELRTENPGRAYPISLGDADVRALAEVPSGAISLTNLYGKSAYIPMTITGFNDFDSANSALGAGTVNCSPSVSVVGGTGGYTYLWSFTSNPGGCSLTNATSAACTVSKSYGLNENGDASSVLQCQVTDNTSHMATKTGITADLSWSNGA